MIHWYYISLDLWFIGTCTVKLHLDTSPGSQPLAPLDPGSHHCYVSTAFWSTPRITEKKYLQWQTLMVFTHVSVRHLSTDNYWQHVRRIFKAVDLCRTGSRSLGWERCLFQTWFFCHGIFEASLNYQSFPWLKSGFVSFSRTSATLAAEEVASLLRLQQFSLTLLPTLSPRHCKDTKTSSVNAMVFQKRRSYLDSCPSVSNPIK